MSRSWWGKLYEIRLGCPNDENRKTFSFIVALISMLTIVASLFALLYSDCIYISKLREIIAIGISLLAAISLISTLILIGYCLLRKTIYEDLDLRDKVVEKNKAPRGTNQGHK